MLSGAVQAYLKENAEQSPSAVALKKSPFAELSSSELAEQVDSRQRLKNKLPHWLAAENIYYPPRQNAEQCSSEASALYKAALVSGKRAIDLTGGFGVDAWALSKAFEQVDYCELNAQLFPIVKHNFQALACTNVRCHLGDGLAFLQDKHYDLIYLDPARRDEHNRKMVSFADCVPNVISHQASLIAQAGQVMIKASPMMDISLALKTLENVKEVHVVAYKNECKELLFILEQGALTPPRIKAVNLPNKTVFDFSLSEENAAPVTYALPKSYLYEAHSAVMKAGAFRSLSAQMKLDKLHPSTHLYTSDQYRSDFPGKVYRITHCLDYHKKSVAKVLEKAQANVKSYNFPHHPPQIKKKLGIKDGGAPFLFGVKTMDEKYQIIVAEKVQG